MLVKDNRSIVPTTIKSNITLTPLQAEAKHSLLNYPNGMLVAPAATGKTIIGLDIVETLGQKTLWLTHLERLLSQVLDRIGTFLPELSDDDIGILGCGKWTIGKKITIGMLETLTRRDLSKLSNEFGLIIVDEAHHIPAITFLKVLTQFNSYYIYGLTASPKRRDGLEPIIFRGIGECNSTIQRKDVLTHGKIITPSVIVKQIPSVVHNGNDIPYILNEMIFKDEDRLNIIAVDVVREASKGNCCMVISTRKAYCQLLYDKIKPYWEKTALVTGDNSKKYIAKHIRKLENREITVIITTPNLLGEGVDVPILNREFLTLPMRSATMVEQCIGRIQRVAANKVDAVLYDYIDSNIGVLKNQFYSRRSVYNKLLMPIEYCS